MALKFDLKIANDYFRVIVHLISQELSFNLAIYPCDTYTYCQSINPFIIIERCIKKKRNVVHRSKTKTNKKKLSNNKEKEKK